MIRIGLAALSAPPSIPAGVEKLLSVLRDCGRQGVDIVCSPETYLPGLRGADFDLPQPDQAAVATALRELRMGCRENGVAVIIGMEWATDLGLENRAFVISASGWVLGHQTKNQITPGGESEHYVPDGKRRTFRVKGVTFGISICHETWRYPETVRWAAVRGAKILFQPQVTGSDREDLAYGPGTGRRARKWGESFYEKAMVCRAGENGIYFASVNQAMRYQNSATSLIDPRGELVDYLPYGKEDVLVADIDVAQATRLYAKRYNPAWYPEA